MIHSLPNFISTFLCGISVCPSGIAFGLGFAPFWPISNSRFTQQNIPYSWRRGWGSTLILQAYLIKAEPAPKDCRTQQGLMLKIFNPFFTQTRILEDKTRLSYNQLTNGLRFCVLHWKNTFFTPWEEARGETDDWESASWDALHTPRLAFSFPPSCAEQCGSSEQQRVINQGVISHASAAWNAFHVFD